jgi:hypothetical protein
MSYEPDGRAVYFQMTRSLFDPEVERRIADNGLMDLSALECIDRRSGLTSLGQFDACMMQMLIVAFMPSKNVSEDWKGGCMLCIRYDDGTVVYGQTPRSMFDPEIRQYVADMALTTCRMHDDANREKEKWPPRIYDEEGTA